MMLVVMMMFKKRILGVCLITLAKLLVNNGLKF